MEIRKVADALLRTQATPLSFLTPSFSTRWQPGLQRSINSCHRKQLQRTFASSSRQYALPTGHVTTAEKPAAKPKDESSASSSSSWLSQGLSSNRPNRFSSSNPENRSGSSRKSELAMNKGSSGDDLLAALNSARQVKHSSSKFDLSRMADPKPQNDIEGLMRNINESVAAPPPGKPPMRLTPSTGRMVTIGGGVDVGRAFRLLEQSCARNKVRADFTKQRFHERGGLKRKRLRRERWRKRFMTGFKAAVSRVKALKNQGW